MHIAHLFSGLQDMGNLVLLCFPCNIGLANMFLEDTSIEWL
jgi:hypothetical protein